MTVLGTVAVLLGIVVFAWTVLFGGSDDSRRCAQIPGGSAIVCMNPDMPERSVERSCLPSPLGSRFTAYTCRD